MHVLRAADEANGRHAVTVAFKSFLPGRNKLGIARKTEVVVRAKVDDILTGRKLHGAGLPTGDDPLGLVETGGFQPVQFGLKMHGK